MNRCRGIRALATVALVGLALSGCAALVPQIGRAKIPAPIGEKGVVIAEMHGYEVEVVGIENGPTVYLNRHRVVVPLAPGKYKLARAVSDSFDGKHTRRTTLPIEREFEVKPGKVTNLGMMYFTFDLKEQDKFYTVTLDNTAEVKRYLRSAYPALAELKESDFLLAPGNYLSAEKLKQFRRVVGLYGNTREYHIRDQNVSPELVAAPAGVIGEYVYKNGIPVDVRLFDTGTLASPVQITRLGERHLVVMSDGSLFLVVNGQLTPLPGPAGAAPIAKAMLTPGGIVLVDERMVAYHSRDEGKQWQRYASAQRTAEEVDANIVSTRDSHGAYVYTIERKPARILYTRDDRPEFKAIPPPTDEWITGLTPTGSGLFATGPYKPFRNQELYFRPTGGTTWEARTLPGEHCMLEFDDASGLKARASCGGAKFSSDDGAKSWQPLKGK